LQTTKLKIEDLSSVEQQAIVHARTARLRAFAPVSNFKVGAAAISKNNVIFLGSNMEEAALNTTIHAEPTAISSANSNGYPDIVTIIVCGDIPGQPNLFLWPCLHCWQFICNRAEKIGHSIEIISVHSDGNEAQKITTAGPGPSPLKFSDIGIDLSK